MNIIEIIILGTLILFAVIYIAKYVIDPFIDGNAPCKNCPHSGGCGKKYD